MKGCFSFFVILLCLTTTVTVSGQTIRGMVCDESAQPMPTVSIYLKSNPHVWASSGMDGTFVFNTEGIKLAEDDVIIFSFIGYKTVEQRVKNVNGSDPVIIKLVEQPILLDGATVTTKVSKKTKNEIKLAFIRKFKEQLVKDFPKANKEYQVVSNAHVTKEGKVLVANEMIGLIREFPQMGKKGRDSLYIEQASIKKYTNPELKKGFREFVEKSRAEAQSAGKNKSKKQPESHMGTPLTALDTSDAEVNKRSMQLHKGLWEWSSNLKSVVDRLDMDPKNWDIAYTNNNAILTYKDKKNLLGIVRYESRMHFILDSDTYSVERVSESVEVEVNIPFGYKLKGEMLDLLNVLNIGGADIEKFRLKHVYGDIKRNVLYVSTENGKFADEKNLEANISLLDNKEQELDYNAKALAKVLSYRLLQ